MSSLFLGQILAKMISGEHARKPTEVPLDPIVPGAWAAWAKAARQAAAGEGAEAIRTARVGPRRVDLVPRANR